MSKDQTLAIDVTGLEDYQVRDLERLRDLFRSKDARGLEQMIAEDPTTDHVIEKVEHHAGSEQTITFNDGWCTTVSGPRVAVGDTVGFYDHEDVNGRHGWALNGKVVEWQTPFERHVARLSMLAGFDRRGRESYDRMKVDIDAWVAQLEGPYLARIERFRAERPDFDVESGGYEVYPVLMAQRIERWCRENGRTVEEFYGLEHELQGPVVHAGAPDKYGISGNQFGAACGLAGAVMGGNTI